MVKYPTTTCNLIILCFLMVKISVLCTDSNTFSIIEGFGGKRALGFLLKSELCQKRSKFLMQFCLPGSNNVLHVFSLKFASFLRYYVCEKAHFSQAILWGPFVERKTKEAFCLAKPWNQYNTSPSIRPFLPRG